MSDHPEMTTDDPTGVPLHMSGGMQLQAHVRTHEQALAWIVQKMDRYSDTLADIGFSCTPHFFPACIGGCDHEHSEDEEPEMVHGFVVVFGGRMVNP